MEDRDTDIKPGDLVEWKDAMEGVDKPGIVIAVDTYSGLASAFVLWPDEHFPEPFWTPAGYLKIIQTI
tara:strand:+ start:293 stop:496 length:204 start_codon:yes stop_codon:yes gene_type:complete